MELFIKRFIDALDEVAPVTMVHTLIEQPLGAVVHDYYIKIHARMDLVDEDSPYVEIEMYPYEKNKVEVLFAYTFPKNSIIINEETWKQQLTNLPNEKADKVIPMENEEDYHYELFYEEDFYIEDNHTKMDELIQQKISKIKEWLLISGYEQVEEDEE